MPEDLDYDMVPCTRLTRDYASRAFSIARCRYNNDVRNPQMLLNIAVAVPYVE